MARSPSIAKRSANRWKRSYRKPGAFSPLIIPAEPAIPKLRPIKKNKAGERLEKFDPSIHIDPRRSKPVSEFEMASMVNPGETRRFFEVNAQEKQPKEIKPAFTSFKANQFFSSGQPVPFSKAYIERRKTPHIYSTKAKKK